MARFQRQIKDLAANALWNPNAFSLPEIAMHPLGYMAVKVEPNLLVRQ